MTIDEHGRPEPPIAAGEFETLAGFLDFQRATLEWKCAGLDAEALNTSVAASSMTLGGMLKHMALVGLIVGVGGALLLALVMPPIWQYFGLL